MLRSRADNPGSADQIGHDPPHVRRVEVVEPFAERRDRRCRFIAPAVGNREHQPEQLFLQRAREASDHAEVDERQPAVARQQHVAWMRVGMEQAVDENLLQVGAEQIPASAGPSTSVHSTALTAVIFVPSIQSIVRTRAVV